MRGFARPSRWSISTSTAIAWLLKGRSVCGGRKTASRDQINHQGCPKRPGFRLESDRKLQLSLRTLGRYEIRHMCRGSLEPAVAKFCKLSSQLFLYLHQTSLQLVLGNLCTGA